MTQRAPAEDVGLVVPTRFDHPDLLRAIIAASGLPPERIVVVATGNGWHETYAATVIHDAGELNIHRWWNEGIDALTARGCVRVAVLNDDVEITPDTLPELAGAFGEPFTPGPHGATLALCGRPGSPSGHAWMLNTSHGVRPDESYTWWCGDLQLQADAAAAGGVVRAPAAWCRHLHHNEATVADAYLAKTGREDQALYDARHPSGPWARNAGWW